MIFSRVRATLALLLLAALPFSFASTSPPNKASDQEPVCTRCGSKGKLPNPVWKKAKLEKDGIFCSVHVEHDRHGGGLREIPCDRCQKRGVRESIRFTLMDQRDRQFGDLDELKKFDKELFTDMVHLRNGAIHLAFGLKKVKVGRRTLDKHEAAHLYMDRLVAVYEDFLSRFGLDPLKDLQGIPHTVFLFDKQLPARDASLKYLGMSSSDGAKKLGYISKFVGYWNRSKQPTEQEFHQHVVHNFAHLLLATLRSGPLYWLGQQGQAGWLDAGFAHYYEVGFFKPPRGSTFCYQEQAIQNRKSIKSWYVETKKLVGRGEAPSLSEISAKSTESLSFPEHVISWSWVEFLIEAQDPKKFPQFVALLKQKTPLPRAMRDAYGMNLARFEEAWREHVKSYPSR